MSDWLENIREIFRERPAMRYVLIAALIIGVFAVWAAFGGYSFEIGRFFAFLDEDDGSGGGGGGGGGGGSSAPTANISVSPTTTTSGGTVNVSWSSTDATTCTTTAGTFSTGGQPNGSATDTISSSFTGTAQFRVRCSGPGGSADSNIASVTVTAAGGGGGGGGGGGATPTDPTGACVFRTQFNAPEGAWFCKSLQCQLDGNPSGGQEYPPKGPASSLAINVYNRSTQAPDPASGPIFVRYILDSTPKCSGGGECYPPKDPLWTCTRPDGKEVDQGRNGHDFYDCYKPIVRIYDDVPVTCCANTGLPGDCYTIKETVPGGASPSVSPSTSPSTSPAPTTSVAPSISAAPGDPVKCAPLTQTVQVGQTARLDAAGGNNAYKWDVTGGGIVEEGGNQYIGIRYRVAGRKTVRVTSEGKSAACTVEVVSGSPTSEPAPAQALSVQKTGRNTTVGGADSASITVNPGQTAQFTVRIVNNSSAALNAVTLTDTLPPGMSYQTGSTRVQNQSIAADTVTTSGLALGVLNPGVSVTVQWSAVADRTATIVSGPNYATPVARVSSSNTSEASSGMSVTVYGSGTTTGAGAVPTGPGDALLAALLVAAVLTLLYSGYTRSDAYRRRDAEAVSRDQGPMDFRS